MIGGDLNGSSLADAPMSGFPWQVKNLYSLSIYILVFYVVQCLGSL